MKRRKSAFFGPRFKQVEAAVAAGQAPELLRCEPVEDNLMEALPKRRFNVSFKEWEVDMSFPSSSELQKSLDNLAAVMIDDRLNRLTLCVRFSVEFPLSPPEVWLRKPRMRYRAGQTSALKRGLRPKA